MYIGQIMSKTKSQPELIVEINMDSKTNCYFRN